MQASARALDYLHPPFAYAHSAGLRFSGSSYQKNPTQGRIFLVELKLKSSHQVWDEIKRWQTILATAFNRYKLTGRVVLSTTSLQ
jgi:hypothetical protein